MAENYRGFKLFEVVGVDGVVWLLAAGWCELLGSDSGELENC